MVSNPGSTASQLPSYVLLGLNCSKPQFPHLQNEINDNIHPWFPGSLSSAHIFTRERNLSNELHSLLPIQANQSTSTKGCIQCGQLLGSDRGASRKSRSRNMILWPTLT